MGVAERIREKLTEALNPDRLDIEDESHRHAGHVGAREGGETHFRIEVVASAFDGVARVGRERLVHAALSEELAGPIHALSVRTLTPEEARKLLKN